MNMITRIKKLEEWLCPAKIVPINVMIVLPGCKVVNGRVYREDQLPSGGTDMSLLEKSYSVPKLVSELKDAEGRVVQRCFLCAVPNSLF